MKNIVLITPYFPPCGGIAVQRITKFCKYLPQLGWNPVVFTPPAYATNMIKDHSMMQDVPKNVQIHRPFFIDYKKILPGDLAKFLKPLRKKYLYPDSFSYWLPNLKKSIHKFASNHQIDAFFITTPSFSLLKIVKHLKLEYNVPVILDMRDPFSTNYYNTDKKRAVEIEKEAFQYASAIISVTDLLVDNLKKAYPQYESKIFLLNNGFDNDDFITLPQQTKGSSDLSVVFTGSFSSLVPLHQFLNATKELLEEKKIKVILSLATNIPKKRVYKKLKKFISLGLVNYLGFLNHKQSIQQLLSHDLLLITMIKENTEGNLSGKIFEYIKADKPILLLNETDSTLGKFIQDTKTGFIADIDQHQEIKDTIELIVHQKKMNSLKIDPNWEYINQFESKNRTQKLVRLIESLQ